MPVYHGALTSHYLCVLHLQCVGSPQLPNLSDRLHVPRSFTKRNSSKHARGLLGVRHPANELTGERTAHACHIALQHPQDIIKSILLRMKVVRIVAATVGALVVVYMIVIVFMPEWMIVGVRFRWPWK